MDALNRIKFLEDRLHNLSEIGMALSTEKNTDRLFEMILKEAKKITRADGRTLYSMDKDGNLKFETHFLYRSKINCNTPYNLKSCVMKQWIYLWEVLPG